MLPPRQMRSLFNVHPQQPWSITCFPSELEMGLEAGLNAWLGGPEAVCICTAPRLSGLPFFCHCVSIGGLSGCLFADGRHMDAYDRVEQYWPAVQQFMAGLQPAQPLPPQPPQALPEPAAKQQSRLEREQELAERKAA